MKYDVFISYSSHDQKVVEGLCGHLESRGIRCFVAYRDIPRGVVWADAIVEALDESRMMVVVFSENFNNSAQVNREIELASEDGKHILTYRLNDIAFRGAKKYYLKNLNWIDAFPNPEQTFGSVAEGVAKLLGLKLKKVVEAEAETPVVPTPKPSPAPKPIPTPAPKPTPTPTPTPKKPYPNYLWALALMPLVLLGLWVGIDSYQEKQAVLREQQAQELAEAKVEQERIAQEKADQERQAQEEAAKKAEQERQAKLEQERIAQAKAEQERQAQEKAAKKAEQERLAKMVAEGKGRDGVYQVGDYYNRNGKQGVVFEVSADGRHGKIVSMMQMSAVYWSIDKVELQQTLGAFSNSDGASNMRIVQGRPNWKQNYPAFAWCATNGDDWYLPAIAEIVKFSISESVHNQVNKTLMKYNGMKLHDIGSANWYWSSTESEEPFDGIGTTDAKMVDMQDQCICDFTKHSDRTVRAVSAF